MKNRRKLAVFRLFAFVVLVPVLGMASTSLVDTAGQAALGDSMARATVAFGVARLLNGAISMVQGTEIGINPFGVGGTFAAGEALDPLNDLVEQLSTVMTVSVVSLGIQTFFLSFLSRPELVYGFGALLFVTAVGASALGVGRGRRLRELVVWLLIMRVGLPVVPAAVAEISDYALRGSYDQAYETLTVTEQELAARAPAVPPAVRRGTILESLGKAVDALGSPMAAIEGRFREYRETAEKAIGKCTDLMVIFLLETVLLPLLVVWLAKLCVSRLVEARPFEGKLLDARPAR